jgi:hypothetical protein
MLACSIKSENALNKTYLDTLALRQTDPWLLAADDEDVAFSGSKLIVHGVLNVDDVKASVVALTMSDDTNTAHVATTGDHRNDTSVELNEVGDLASGEINLDRVVDLDEWVWISDTKHILYQHCSSPKLGPTSE